MAEDADVLFMMEKVGGVNGVAARPGQQQHGGQGVVPEQQEGQWRAQLAGRHQVAAGPAASGCWACK